MIFCHPFGQIGPGRIAPVQRMRTLTVDYAGNVYTTRRGRSFGNVRDADLGTLLAQPALRASYGAPERHARDAADPGASEPVRDRAGLRARTRYVSRSW